MGTLTIRGIDNNVSQKLKEKAQEDNSSINQTVVRLLKKALGLEGDVAFKEYNDLDDLAGTWSKKDLKEFSRNTDDFSRIDRDLWK